MNSIKNPQTIHKCRESKTGKPELAVPEQDIVCLQENAHGTWEPSAGGVAVSKLFGKVKNTDWKRNSGNRSFAEFVFYCKFLCRVKFRIWLNFDIKYPNLLMSIMILINDILSL
ncbi:hypothetical protein CDAR_273491 [Caerostris darwini]|uniref:Uncharacterized protein n=1 Tax=Caerostris darwini TaxID=1538125 RepID=A0AAV4W548_9ARAC|nr:hypothetical protein CDAR_273491 [Caerostris darwini]